MTARRATCKPRLTPPAPTCRRALKSNPTYNKVNPADAPILILALTSKTLTQGQIYDAASNVFQQQLSQITGIGQVILGGAALPAVRVELNPQALFKYGIGLEDVRAALAAANANSPKGTIDDGSRRFQIYSNDQSTTAADYAPLVIAYRNGAAVRLSDVASVSDSVEDVRNLGLSNGQPSVLVILFRQPGANIVETIDSIKAELPHLEAAMPADVNVTIAIDRSTTIRQSLSDTELTLVIAIALVTIVVYFFLRSFRATAIPSVAVPVSILGTFGAMYLLNYSLDILSLMALTIATGFVVDDAIVVLENISRHLEAGMPRLQAALLGAREVGFTVLSISLSLIAVFLPILLMGGILGRLFREFTMTLSLAIMISLVISLTTTPMMCALFLRPPQPRQTPRRRGLFDRVLAGYEHSLTWALQHSRFVLFIFFGAIVLNVVLFAIVPKGFFPDEDTGRMIGSLQADQSVSFQLMTQKLRQMMDIVQQDPAVEHVVGYTGVGSGGGFGQINTGSVFVSLKPIEQRPSMEQVIARLRPKLAKVPGGRLFLFGVQDIRAGGRQSNAQYQYTLQADDPDLLSKWTALLVSCARTLQGHGRRQLRSATAWPGIRSGYRPADRLAARHHAGADRQHPLRRLRAAPSFRHLQRDQSISRRHGDRSTLYAISDVTARYLRGDVRRRRVGNAAIERARGRGIRRQSRSRQSNVERNRSGQCQQQFGAQCRHQRAGQFRQKRHILGRCGVDRGGDHGAACRVKSLQCRQCAALRQSSRVVRRLYYFVQFAAGRGARRRGERNRRRH